MCYYNSNFYNCYSFFASYGHFSSLHHKYNHFSLFHYNYSL